MSITIVPPNELKVGESFFLSFRMEMSSFKDKDFIALYKVGQSDDAYGQHWYGIRPDRITAGGVQWYSPNLRCNQVHRLIEWIECDDVVVNRDAKFAPWENGVYEFRVFRQQWRVSTM
jgi:hypothetical protein